MNSQLSDATGCLALAAWAPAITLAAALFFAAGPAASTGSSNQPPERAPDTLDVLMAHFAASGGVRARFRETRKLAILALPIESRGLLYFSPPDRLARLTTHPGASRVVVHGTRVVFVNETGRTELDLASSAVARGLVSNLVVLLRGDLPELRARYSVRYSTDDQNWQLRLEPRSRDMRALVERVVATGEGRVLTRMDTFETNGDVTSLHFSEVETGFQFVPGESDDVFSFEASGQGK